jgi:hypothetical protein
VLQRRRGRGPVKRGRSKREPGDCRRVCEGRTCFDVDHAVPEERRGRSRRSGPLDGFTSLETISSVTSSSSFMVVASAIVGVMLVVGGVFLGLRRRSMQHELLRMDDYSETPSASSNLIL